MKAPKQIDVPKHLKAWRRKSKLTQQAAADRLGISRRSYEKWEQAERTPRGLSLSALMEKTRA